MHYENWYKVENEINNRYLRRKKEFFKTSSIPEMAKVVAKETIKQSSLIFHEAIEGLKNDQKIFLENGDMEYLFKFNNIENINKWKVNSDAGYEIGNSEVSLDLTEQNTGMFKGFLRNDFDKPEKMKATYTGYANMTSLPNYKSFYRKTYINLQDFTHFRLRLRGDGRNYMFILKNDNQFVETQTYLVMHPLYTHGGPYWQDLRIPFSKFFQVSHGRVADRQFRFVDNDLVSLGITCMDGIEGPFGIELESIGVYRDTQMLEELAYETYKIPKYISNT